MIKKIFFLTLLISTASLITVYIVRLATKPQEQKQLTHKEIYLTINDTKIKIEPAVTPAEKSQGLSGRNSLPKDTGMLFDFTREQDARPSFWMKDMRFDLDIVWIKNLEITYIHKNVPRPLNQDTLPTYSPPSSIDYVLELPSGYTDEKKISTGNKIKIETD